MTKQKKIPKMTNIEELYMLLYEHFTKLKHFQVSLIEFKGRYPESTYTFMKSPSVYMLLEELQEQGKIKLVNQIGRKHIHVTKKQYELMSKYYKFLYRLGVLE